MVSRCAPVNDRRVKLSARLAQEADALDRLLDIQ